MGHVNSIPGHSERRASQPLNKFDFERDTNIVDNDVQSMVKYSPKLHHISKLMK